MADLSKRAGLNREVRKWAFSDVELRDAGDDGLLHLRGSASVVEHPYSVRDMLGEFTETIRRGAFDKTLSENPDVVLLVNHEGLPLARTTSGTLRLAANPDLGVEADLEPADPDVQRVDKKMRRGDLNEMSFAFRVTKQAWNDDYTEREIQEVSLQRGDVSIVTYGANPATSAALRGLGCDVNELDAAIEAMRAQSEDDVQRELVERAHRALGEVLDTGKASVEAEIAVLVAAETARLEDVRFERERQADALRRLLNI